MTFERVDLAEGVTLWTGECAAVMAAHIPDASIDLTVTSPPYDNLRTYNGFTFDFEAIAAQLWRVTKPGGVVVWVVGDATVNGSETGTSFRQALRFMELGFNLVDTMIWEKTGQGAVGGYYWQNFEYMFIFANGSPLKFTPLKDRENVIGSGKVKTNGGRDASGGWATDRIIDRKPMGRRFNVWRINEQRNTAHPAPFPEALARDHILSWSNPGDLVLDPMCGSGTTLKMAVLTGRRCIGIDISAEYVELARERIANALQQPRLFQPDAVAPPQPEQGKLL